MKYLYIIIIILLIGVIYERNTLPPTTDDMIQEAQTFGVANNKTVPPKAFKQDGCTLFPDNILGSDFKEACLKHDIVYWYGGTEAEKDSADQTLKKEVAETGITGYLLQVPFYLGVHYFGDTWLTKFFDANWGFGWNK